MLNVPKSNVFLVEVNGKHRFFARPSAASKKIRKVFWWGLAASKKGEVSAPIFLSKYGGEYMMFKIGFLCYEKETNNLPLLNFVHRHKRAQSSSHCNSNKGNNREWLFAARQDRVVLFLVGNKRQIQRQPLRMTQSTMRETEKTRVTYTTVDILPLCMRAPCLLLHRKIWAKHSD